MNPYKETINLHTVEIEIKDLYNQIEKILWQLELVQKFNDENTVLIEELEKKINREFDRTNHEIAKHITTHITKTPKRQK